MFTETLSQRLSDTDHFSPKLFNLSVEVWSRFACLVKWAELCKVSLMCLGLWRSTGLGLPCLANRHWVADRVRIPLRQLWICILPNLFVCSGDQVSRQLLEWLTWLATIAQALTGMAKQKSLNEYDFVLDNVLEGRFSSKKPESFSGTELWALAHNKNYCWRLTSVCVLRGRENRLWTLDHVTKKAFYAQDSGVSPMPLLD